MTQVGGGVVHFLAGWRNPVDLPIKGRPDCESGVSSDDLMNAAPGQNRFSELSPALRFCLVSLQLGPSGWSAWKF
jgi:hypothetical protein